MQIPIWSPEYLAPSLVWGLLCIGFSIYHFVSISSRVEAQFINRYGAEAGATRFVLFTRYLGGFTIGLIPALLMVVVLGQPLSDFGFKFQNGLLSLYWIVGIAAIVIPMNYFNTQKEKHLEQYPTIRQEEWSMGLLVNTAFSWVFYLFGYELMFRGLLLFASVPLLGAWPAIILNVVFYVLVHIPKNLEESIGAVPLGLLLCLITLTTGTIWVAFFVHITLALSNLFLSIRHHPQISIKR
jgi:membrane protease YdiL (CAAX protease family)